MVREAPPSYMAATESSARPRSRQRLTCLFRPRNSRSSRLHPFPEKTLNDETNMEKEFMEKARLGLIGDNIAASQAPRLHALAGALQRIAVRYDLLVPAELGLGFDALFDRCADGSYHGINVTHPYKERAAAAGLDTVSGFELFFHQGADGFEIFFGGTVDRVRLRRAVGEPGRASAA